MRLPDYLCGSAIVDTEVRNMKLNIRQDSWISLFMHDLDRTFLIANFSVTKVSVQRNAHSAYPHMLLNGFMIAFINIVA